MCKKICYKSKSEAIKLMFHYRTQNPNRTEKGAYYCKECKAWHLTSQINKWTPLLPNPNRRHKKRNLERKR